jgi:uncharacterized protein YqjF (DUF2071 family)
MPPTPFLTAHWSALLMLSWEVPRDALLPFVPRGTELDDVDGAVHASMVGFRFERTRLRGIPVPLHGNFDEVNLRFYVRRRVEGNWRRAAVFISEIVPMPAIAWTAKLLYNEKYQWCRMRHAVDLGAAASGGAGQVRFEWRHRGRWHHLAATTTGMPTTPAEGSLDRFISEHYYGYSSQRDGGTVEYAVVHPMWRVWSVADWSFSADVASLYGDAFAAPLSEAPVSAFVAEGSHVAVHAGVRI